MAREYTIEMIQGTTVMEKMRNLIKLVVEFMNTMDAQSVEAEREERIQADALLQEQIDTLNESKQDVLTWDTVPTQGSVNPVTSEGIKSYVDAHTIDLDTEMSDTSENAVMNRVIKAYVDEHTFDLDDAMSDTSENAVMNKVIKTYVDSVQSQYLKLNSDTPQAVMSPVGIQGGVNAQIQINTDGMDGVGIYGQRINLGSPGSEIDALIAGSMIIPDTRKGSTGKNAVNSDRLMAELQDIPTTIDTEMSDTSENPVQNKVIKQYVDSETVQKNLGSTQSQEIEGGLIVDESLQVPGIFVVDQSQGQTVINTPKGESGVKVVNENRLMEELADKQDVLTFDDFPTSASDNPVKSGGVYFGMNQLNEAVSQINNELVSLQTTKQDKMSATSPIKITSNDISIEMDTSPTQNSKKPVTSGGLKTQFNNVAQDITTLSNLLNTKANTQDVILKNGKQTKNGEMDFTNDVQYQEVAGINLVNNKFSTTSTKWLAQINVFAMNGVLSGRLVWVTDGTGKVTLQSMCLNADGTERWINLNA